MNQRGRGTQGQFEFSTSCCADQRRNPPLTHSLPAPGFGVPARHGTKQDIVILKLRHYALSSCLRQAFPSIAYEADAAKDAFLQNGSHPAEAYQAIQPMAGEWLRRSYLSFRDVNLTIVKCINFAESAV